MGRGKLVAVIGYRSVGSGKSSLINAFVDEMPLQGGICHIFENNDPSSNNGLNHCIIGYSSQTPFVINNSLRENGLFGLPCNKSKYKKSALATDIEILANGDKTQIGEMGVNLSGGQKARISFACALYRAHMTDLLLFDDCSSAVDINVGNIMFHDGIYSALDGKTRIMLINSHLHVDMVVIIDNGQIVAQTSYKEVMKVVLMLTYYQKKDLNVLLNQHLNLLIMMIKKQITTMKMIMKMIMIMRMRMKLMMAGKFFVEYLIGFINNVLTIMFSIKMFQKLPMAIFAVAWESTTADDESLLPFNGADELLLSISGTLFIPTIILIIIVVSYATCIRGTISKYLQLQDKHKKARRKVRQQKESAAAIGSGDGDSGGADSGGDYKPLVTATTSVVITLFLMIDFLGSPVSMFRRGYTSTRADHNVVNALLAVMMIMWFGGMLFISKLVRWSLKSVIGFVGFRIVYGIFLVLPLYLYVGERFETRSEMTKEDPDNLKFQEYSVGVIMILCVGMMIMLIMPHLSSILGLTVGTIISIGFKVGGLAALAILAESSRAFSKD